MKLVKLFMPFMLLSLFLYSCEKTPKPVLGCMNQFAINFDKSADSPCCCEYDIDEIINSVVGTYKFTDYCQHFNFEYRTKIKRHEVFDSIITIENFGAYEQTFNAKFENGYFMISDSFYSGGCKFEFRGHLEKSEDKIMIVSNNKVLEGLCDNITDLECTAIAN